MCRTQMLVYGVPLQPAVSQGRSYTLSPVKEENEAQKAQLACAVHRLVETETEAQGRLLEKVSFQGQMSGL